MCRARTPIWRCWRVPSRVTHCPYKGDANYFSILADGKTIENSIWTYETPFPAMAEISGHLAFYPDKVKIEEVGLICNVDCPRKRNNPEPQRRLDCFSLRNGGRAWLRPTP